MPDPLDDASHGLMRDIQITCHCSQPLVLHPGRDLYPTLPRDAWSFGRRGVPADAGSPSRSQESIGIEERHQWQIDDVYLA